MEGLWSLQSRVQASMHHEKDGYQPRINIQISWIHKHCTEAKFQNCSFFVVLKSNTLNIEQLKCTNDYDLCPNQFKCIVMSVSWLWFAHVWWVFSGVCVCLFVPWKLVKDNPFWIPLLMLLFGVNSLWHLLGVGSDFPQWPEKQFLVAIDFNQLPRCRCHFDLTLVEVFVLLAIYQIHVRLSYHLIILTIQIIGIQHASHFYMPSYCHIFTLILTIIARVIALTSLARRTRPCGRTPGIITNTSPSDTRTRTVASHFTNLANDLAGTRT